MDVATLPLTQTNRAYLPQVRYAADDYATIRARLLERFAEAFPHWNPTLENNRGAQDFGVVFIELFAQFATIFNCYSDAYVNEGLLRTATTSRSLMDLAELVDYRLDAGASSTTYQAFLTRTSGATQGVIPAGFKLQAQLQPNAPALTFETAFALAVDAVRNELHLFDYARSERLLHLRANAADVQDSDVLLDQAFPALKAGAPIVFDDGVELAAVPLVAAASDDDKTRIVWSPGAAALDHDSAISELVIRARPKQTMRLAAAARADEITLGQSVVPVFNAAMFTLGGGVLISSDGLQMGAIVLAKTITTSPAGTITLNRGVVASLRRSSTSIYEGTSCGHTFSVVRAGATAITRVGLGFKKKSFPHNPAPGDTLLLVDAAGVELATVASVSASTIYLTQPLARALRPTPHLFDATPSVRLFSVAPSGSSVHVTQVRPLLLGELSGVYQGSDTVLALDKTYNELTAGTVVALSDGVLMRAHIVASSAVVDNKTQLMLQGAAAVDFRVALLGIYGPFEYAMRVDGFDRSERVLAAGASELELHGAIPGLAAGGLLVLRSDEHAEGVRITQIDLQTDRTTVALSRPLEHAYPLAMTTIYGNVVAASHGASAPEEVLGSGDAAQSHQRFLLRRSPLTFLPDPTAERGVASALEIFVGDERWTIIDSLADSTPTSHEVMLSIDDRARAYVQFGDGVHGAKPATGRNNIRARYRVGLGVRSNTPADAINKMPQALPFLARTLNPLAAAGGADAQTPANARRAIGYRVRTLERAVSLQDYAELALTFAGVAKARADFEYVGMRRIIYVTVAAEGGAPLSPELVESLQAFIATRAWRPQRFTIRDAERVPARLSVAVTLLPNFVRSDVERRVLQALGAEWNEDGTPALFTFDALELGADLALSTVYRTIETLRGVDHVLANAFHIEGDAPAVLDRIRVPPHALLSGGHSSDAGVGRLTLQVIGGLV